MALASAFPAGPQAGVRPCGKGSVGEAGDQPDGAQGLGSTQGGWPVKRKISWAAWTSPAGRKAVGRSSRRSAAAHELGQPAEVSRSGARSAGRRQGLGWTQGGWPVKREISWAAWTSSAGRKAVGRSSRRSAGYAWAGPHGPQWEKPHHGQDRAGRRRRGNPGWTKEEAPPRMRWRGPSDPAAPNTAISCSASVPLDQPPSRIPA
jgi:hypothetical protein